MLKQITIFFIPLLIIISLNCDSNDSSSTSLPVDCDGAANGYFYLTNNTTDNLQCKIFLTNNSQEILVDINNNQTKELYEVSGLGPCRAINENMIYPAQVISKIEIYTNNNNNLLLKSIYDPILNDDWVYDYDDVLQENQFYLIINE